MPKCAVDHAAVFQAGPSPLAVFNPELRICDVNAAFCDLSGRHRSELLGRALFEVFPQNPGDPSDDGPQNLRDSLQRVMATGLPDPMPVQRYDVAEPDGRFVTRYWSPINVPVLAGDGSVQLVVHRVVEVPATAMEDSIGGADNLKVELIARARELARVNQELLAARDQLAARALHDPLTGLLVRSAFLESLAQSLARLERDPHPVAVLFLDLDGLKFVNDTYGHAAGDRLIRTCAQRIRAAVRPGDPVARIGGDEFVVLLGDLTSESEATTVAERILDHLRTPCRIDPDTLVDPSASIGIAVTSASDLSAETMIAHADAAMYRAKHSGRGRFALFDPTSYAAATASHHLQSELHAGLERQEFTVHYQPIMDLADGQVHAVEALVRWQHPVRGLLAAGEFIEVAESSRLIIDIGRQVISQACRQLAAWDRELGERAPRQLFCNMSTAELTYPDLHAHLAGVLAATGLDADRVVVEVTETGALSVDASGVLDTLRGMGCQVAIDDFGTGYSTLGRLMDLRADILKIDQSFVRDFDSQPQAVAVVSAVLLMAHNLRKGVVAEGIEAEATSIALRELGCTYGQGYHLGRPQPAEDVTHVLTRPTAPVQP